jgi:aryl-alcohol dehydrogenase-like predicted oxidoreductase
MSETNQMDKTGTTNALLQKRKLGRTGFMVTPLGLGGAWLGYDSTTHTRDEEVGIAAVLRALDLGINLIDTSGGYGPSEIIIGKALQRHWARGGRREDIIISTKTGTRTNPRDYSAAATCRSVETSLRSLQVDYIDVMLVHDPDNIDPVFAPDGALQALHDLKSQGLIRAIGLGVRNHAHHMRFIGSGHGEVSLTFGDFNMLNQSAAQDILPAAAQCDVGIFNGMAIEYGLLGGGDPLELIARSQHHFPEDKVQSARALWEWATAHHQNLLAVNLQWIARESRIAATLVGAASPTEVTADVVAFTQPIPESLWADLHERFNL